MMLTWEPPRRLGAAALPIVHLSTCRRATITEDVSPLPGEPHLFTVAITAAPDRVHPTLSSLEEAKAYASTQLDR